ncbi:Poly (A) polymerase [Rhynchospora pubera]|uniref:Poly (A) polymerase n=1 Tax=Rhynchospora pubera TaxID=906938 RepID=A0AAV8FC27_9POAL|nr:Poly (A) polymerase [Rhynchospora pubera]
MVIRAPELGTAVARIGAISKHPSLVALRPSIAICSATRRRRYSAGAAVLEPPTDAPSSSAPPSSINGGGRQVVEGPNWKFLNTNEVGICTSMISKPTRSVLKQLKKKGYEAYLVGGCVRDLIMQKTPKDFDVITTAELWQVKKAFRDCQIIGRRFPICHVHINRSIIEVSSFNTHVERSKNKMRDFKKLPNCNEQDIIRWRNCLSRDFTINGLMLNPFSNKVYDYLGGMDDLKKGKVRTIIPARSSFQEDCARILRAIRIAARLGFSFSRETAYSVKDLASSILRLDKQRILMEMNYMLAYGSAEASLRLLWKFGLLELLLPIQAAYFVSHGFKRKDKRTNMLLGLFSNLDRLLAPDQPCHRSLWIALFAFHEALVRQPRDPLVVAAFTLALYNGGNMEEAFDIVRKISHPHDHTFPELSGNPVALDSDKDLKIELRELAISVESSLSSMTDEYFVSRAMSMYPQAPSSNLVFIPLPAYQEVCRIFECIMDKERENNFLCKSGKGINYYNLSHGSLSEVRYVFARVVFDTVYPPNLENNDQETVHED